MTIQARALSLALSLLCVCSFAAPSAAFDDEGWRAVTHRFKVSGDVPRDIRDKFYPIEIMASGDTGAGDVAFICAYGKLYLRIMVEDGSVTDAYWSNMKRIYSRTTNKARSFKPMMTIGGAAIDAGKWMETREDRMVMPENRKMVAKLYNAAIRGQDVRYQRKGGPLIDLNLPKPDRTFAQFGQNCKS